MVVGSCPLGRYVGRRECPQVTGGFRLFRLLLVPLGSLVIGGFGEAVREAFRGSLGRGAGRDDVAGRRNVVEGEAVEVGRRRRRGLEGDGLRVVLLPAAGGGAR